MPRLSAVGVLDEEICALYRECPEGECIPYKVSTMTRSGQNDPD